MLVCVRWYVAYPLSLRHIEEMMQELAASYALAAHEIGLIRQQSLLPSTDDEFSLFVGDAENAFSREHTQWIARKDT